MMPVLCECRANDVRVSGLLNKWWQELDPFLREDIEGMVAMYPRSKNAEAHAASGRRSWSTTFGSTTCRRPGFTKRCRVSRSEIFIPRVQVWLSPRDMLGDANRRFMFALINNSSPSLRKPPAAGREWL